jgi:predicted nucleotidyltransferase
VPKQDLEAILSRLRELHPALHEQYGVSEIWVFGSYVRGEQDGDSDLDVLIEFDRPGMTLFKFVELEMAMSEQLGVKVDLVRRRALHERLRPGVLAEAVAV